MRHDPETLFLTLNSLSGVSLSTEPLQASTSPSATRGCIHGSSLIVQGEYEQQMGPLACWEGIWKATFKIVEWELASYYLKIVVMLPPHYLCSATFAVAQCPVRPPELELKAFCDLASSSKPSRLYQHSCPSHSSQKAPFLRPTVGFNFALLCSVSFPCEDSLLPLLLSA